MPRKPLALAAVLALALTAPAAHAAIVPGQVIDGPNNLVQKFSALDMAPDGTGALAYVKKVGMPSQEHIFVSRFTGGTWTAPEDVSTAAMCPCGSADVAAGNGGRVLVTFTDVNLNLQSALKANGASPFQLLPVDVGGGIQDAHVDMDPVSGIAYAIKDIAPAPLHVTASRLVSTTWANVTTGVAGNPLDKDPTNASAGGIGSMSNGQIAVDSSGNAVAVWPEKDGAMKAHVYVRRITGTVAGTTVEASVPSLAGHAADGANAEMVDIDGGGSPNPWVVFREQFTYGMVGHVRDLARQLVGDTLSPPQVVDGLPLDTPSEGAEHPYIDVNSAGQGLLALPTQMSSQIIGSALAGGTWTPGFQVDPGVPLQPPFPVAAIADSGNGLIAWVDSSTGPQGRVQARERVGGVLGAPFTLSRDGDGGLLAGDPPVAVSSSAAGTTAIGFGQQGAATSTIVAAIVDLPNPTSGPPPGKDTTAPTVSSLKLSRTTFALGPKLATISKKRKTPVGTTISFNVSEASKTTFSFARKTRGFRSGKRCVTKRPKGKRKARPCSRFISVKPSLVFTTPAGTHRLRFQGRLSRTRKLKPGSYRLTVTSVDAAGNRSKARTANFRLKKK